MKMLYSALLGRLILSSTTKIMRSKRI